MVQRLRFLLLFFLGFFIEGAAQDTIRISQQDILKANVDRNLQVQLASRDAAIARTQLLKAREMYLPNIMASYGFINTNDPMMVFGAKLNQKRITAMDFDPAGLNNPDAINSFTTKIEVQQPIFNQGALYEKKAGQVREKVLEIQSERTKEQVRFALQRAYFSLQLAYKIRQTLEDAMRTVLANKKVIEDYYKNGLVQKSEVLFVDVRESEIKSQLQAAGSNIQNASDDLLLLLNKEDSAGILKPDQPLTYQQMIIPPQVNLDLSRKDLMAMTETLKSYDWMVKSEKAKLLPTLNAFGNFGMNDRSFGQFRANSYFVGLDLSWNIFDGLKSQSQQAVYRAQKDQLQLQIQQYTKQSKLELGKAARAVKDSDAKVIFAQQALTQSKEAYRIQKNRYDQGLLKSADLLAAETLMAQKDLQLQQAIFEHNTAVAYYQFLEF